MKIEKKLVVVEIGDNEDKAVLTFDRLKENIQSGLEFDLAKAHKDQAETDDKLLAVNNYADAILGACISIENLFNPDGSSVSIEQLKARDLYPEIINMITTGYVAALNPRKETREAEEKNLSLPDSTKD